ncbi:chromatin-remodeling complex subunit ies6 [Elasticomyces elasticus]|nr:chromatin-remodeling complex subunit ies6 [Elasticomyces elasticus]KAK3668455.1 chromatin-remodeling complex subunit ies6 [Elasticomyces elasticus]KAK4930856.1 chromatin-remodeling complex subunit ies6 [Elasticomyces elasticus]KAK5753693.1 chromatin-remodeling complex subunit ies6 [Elasticomyces elasticus]
MAPITTASNEETHMALLNQLDMTNVPKPFKQPNWKPAQRRNKNLKQILAEEARTQQQRSSINTQQNSGAVTPQIATNGGAAATLHPNPAQGSQDLSRVVLENNTAAAQAVPPTGPSVTYTSIAAGPSTKKPQKYCDITGLPCKYTDPKTGMYYYNAEMYKRIQSLTTAQVQEYLEIRKANTVLNGSTKRSVTRNTQTEGSTAGNGRAPPKMTKKKVPTSMVEAGRLRSMGERSPHSPASRSTAVLEDGAQDLQREVATTRFLADKDARTDALTQTSSNAPHSSLPLMEAGVAEDPAEDPDSLDSLARKLLDSLAEERAAAGAETEAQREAVKQPDVP